MEDVPERLIVIYGPNSGTEYLLVGDEYYVGRSANNAIVLPLPEISRRHARLFKVGEQYHLEDLGSTNGTYVNGARLSEPVTLRDGDEIRIGDSFRLLYTSSVGDVRMEGVAPGASGTEPPVVGPTHVEAYTSEEIPTPKPPLPVPQVEAPLDVPETMAESGGRRWFLTCGCAALILVTLCFATIFFLDAYEGGRLLYCGSLRPFFQLFLGPLGFNPVCP